jgi:hypothetical protein
MILSIKINIHQYTVGSPNEFLHKPILKYLTDRNVQLFLNKRVQELIYEKDITTGNRILNS